MCDILLFVISISTVFSPQGKIDMLDTKVIAENTQLAVDYETVSNVIPPAKKATLGHTVSSLCVFLSIFVVCGLKWINITKGSFFTPK